MLQDGAEPKTFFFLMERGPTGYKQSGSAAAADGYKRPPPILGIEYPAFVSADRGHRPDVTLYVVSTPPPCLLYTPPSPRDRPRFRMPPSP